MSQNVTYRYYLISLLKRPTNIRTLHLNKLPLLRVKRFSHDGTPYIHILVSKDLLTLN